MNEAANGQVAEQNRAKQWPIRLLCAVVAVEAVVMLVVTVRLVIDLLTRPANSMASAIALTALAGLATVLLVALTVGILREQRWVRGPVTMWQMLQAAVAVPIIQGDLLPLLGWALAALSLVGLLLVVHPAVFARLTAR